MSSHQFVAYSFGLSSGGVRASVLLLAGFTSTFPPPPFPFLPPLIRCYEGLRVMPAVGVIPCLGADWLHNDSSTMMQELILINIIL